MCIIAGTLRSVSKTNILAIPSLDKTRQLTIYSNKVDVLSESLMILPVPFPETVVFHETLMRYKSVFEDASNSFEKVLMTLNPLQTWSRASTVETLAALPTRRIGPYTVSIANSFEDLERLNPTTFRVDPALKEFLQTQYRPTMGFVCCVLTAGHQEYQPLAYSHQISGETLFVPTMHYHSKSTYTYTPAALDIADDWDHAVYTIGTVYDNAHTRYQDSEEWIPQQQNKIQWAAFPDQFVHGPLAALRCWRRVGAYKNMDLEFQLTSALASPQSSPGRDEEPDSLEHALRGLRGIFKSGILNLRKKP